MPVDKFVLVHDRVSGKRKLYRWVEGRGLEMMEVGDLELVECRFYDFGGKKCYVELVFRDWVVEGEYDGTFEEILMARGEPERMVRVLANVIDSSLWVRVKDEEIDAKVVGALISFQEFQS